MVENPYRSPETQSEPPVRRGWRPGWPTYVLLTILGLWGLGLLMNWFVFWQAARNRSQAERTEQPPATQTKDDVQ
jgi:hypothetical protein